ADGQPPTTELRNRILAEQACLHDDFGECVHLGASSSSGITFTSFGTATAVRCSSEWIIGMMLSLRRGRRDRWDGSTSFLPGIAILKALRRSTKAAPGSYP